MATFPERPKPQSTPLNEHLELPIPGADGVTRTYRIPPPTADVWVRLAAVNIGIDNEIRRRAWALACEKMLADGFTKDQLPPEPQYEPEDPENAQIVTATDLYRFTLGAETLAAMRADGVSAADLKHASATANVWIMSGCDDEAALVMWLGKAQAQVPQTKTP